MSDERLRELERLVATGEAPPERLEYERWRRSVPSDLDTVVAKVGWDLVRNTAILDQALCAARVRRMSGEEFLVLAVQALTEWGDRLAEMATRILSERRYVLRTEVEEGRLARIAAVRAAHEAVLDRVDG